MVDAVTTRTDYHVETAAVFLTRAQAYLADGDLLQASEKGWGAAAQMVKAVAEARGWNHNGHRQLHQAVERLATETGQPELQSHFSGANTLHQNFYDGLLAAEDVRAYLERVERFVELLGPLSA